MQLQNILKSLTQLLAKLLFINIVMPQFQKRDQMMNVARFNLHILDKFVRTYI